MVKHSILLVLLCFTINATHAQEPTTSTVADIPQAEPTSEAVKPSTPKPKPKNAAAALTKVIRIIVALLRDPEVKENLILIEKLIVAIIQTAKQVSQANKHAPTRSLAGTDNDVLVAELTQVIISESESLQVYRVCTHNKQSGMDEETKAILLNFAAMVQNFFNILQAPEDKDNVAPNIMGIMGGMGNIITIATTKGIPLDTEEEIRSFAQDLDTETKRTMHRMILNTQKQRSILLAS